MNSVLWRATVSDGTGLIMDENQRHFRPGKNKVKNKKPESKEN